MGVQLSFMVDGIPEVGKRHVNPDGTIGGWVSPSAEIGSNVYIHPTSVIGPWGVVGSGAIIGAGTRLGLTWSHYGAKSAA